VQGQGGEPFQDWSFEGGGESLTHNDIFIRVQADVGDIYLDMLVGVCVPNVAFQCKGFPLAVFVWMCWYVVSNDGLEGGGVMMRRDMGGGEGGKGGCGEGVRGRVVLAFFFSWLTWRDIGVLLLFALLVGICFYPSFQSRILLPQHLHLISIAYI